jgi:hypothetical protein
MRDINKGSVCHPRNRISCLNRDQSESESRKRHTYETDPEGRTRTSRFPTHNSQNTSARQTPTQDQQNKADLSVSDLLLGLLSPRLAARHQLTSVYLVHPIDLIIPTTSFPSKLLPLVRSDLHYLNTLPSPSSLK